MTFRQILRTRSLSISTCFALAFFGSSAFAQGWVNMGGNPGGEGSNAFTGLAQAPEANLFSGSMSTSIPIQLPPGRAQATPELSVAYSSSSGESPFGFGWDLAIGSIERGTKRGVSGGCVYQGDIDNTDDFVLNLPGATVELVNVNPPNGNVYRAKFDEAYVEATASKGSGNSNNWVVRDRRGMTFRFGQTVESRRFRVGIPPASGDDVFMNQPDPDSLYTCRFTAQWLLTQIEDPNGNTIDITYAKVENVSYPTEIQYGANPSAGLNEHPFRAVFAWADRPIDVFNRRLGIHYRLTQVLDRIDVEYKAGPSTAFQTVRAYDFTHTPDDDNNRMYLSAVDVLDPEDDPLVPTQTFTYASADIAPHTPTVYTGRPNNYLRRTDPSDAPPLNPGVIQTVMDMNGDGRMDFVSSIAPGNQWYIYYGTDDGPSTSATSWSLPFANDGLRLASVVEDDNTHTHFDTLDITGDGIPDFVDGRQTPWRVWRGVCTEAETCGFVAPYISWSAPEIDVEFVHGTQNPKKVWTAKQLIDMNADGRPDLVKGDFEGGDWRIWLNNGTGFESQRWKGFWAAGPLGVEDGSGGRVELTIMDFNGDGLPDRLTHIHRTNVYTSGPQTGESTGTTGGCPSPNPLALAPAGALQVELNTGVGFAAPIVSATPYFVLPGDDNEEGAMKYYRTSSGPKENRTLVDLIDINGDGLPDWVYQSINTTAAEWYVVLNQGDGRLGPLVVPTNPSCSNTTDPFDQVVWGSLSGPTRKQWKDADPGHWYTEIDVLDWNNDGLLDYVDTDRSTSWQVWKSKYANGAEAPRPGLLVKSDNGFGGVTEVRYEPSTRFNYDDPEGPIAGLPFNTWVVSAIRRSDGLCTVPQSADPFDPLENTCIGTGHELLQRFEYANGFFDPVSREFRGFGQVSQIDTDGNVVETEFSQEDATRGKVLRESVLARDGSSFQTVSEKSYVWDTRTSLGRTQVYLAEERSERFAAFTSSPPASQCLVTRNEPPDDYGRISTTCSNPCGASSAGPGECSPAVFGQVETATTWANPQSGYHVYDRPSQVETSEFWDFLGNPFALPLVTKNFYYDNLTQGLVNKGNVHRTSTPVAASVIGIGGNAEVLTVYDPFGNVTGMTDPNGHVTVYFFSSSNFNLYHGAEWKADMPPAFQIYRQTDLRYGKPTQITDENGAVTVAEYDALGRTTCESGPGDVCSSSQPLEATQRFVYGFGNPAASTYEGKLSFLQVNRMDPVASNGVVIGRKYVDALGRSRLASMQQVVGTSTSVSTVISGQTDYDARSRVARTYAPYAQSGAIPATPTTAQTQYDYTLNGNAQDTPDPLGRVYQLTPPDGNVTSTFHEGTRTRVRDPRGDETWSIRDAYDRETRKEQRIGSTTVEMAFEYWYDGLGRVYSSRTSGVNATINSSYFDGLGRVISRNDPDSGNWLYGYDLSGNLVYQNDPKPNQHVQMCYDVLDRIELRCTFSSSSGDYVANACSTGCAGGTVESSYVYDESANGLTRLASVTDLSGSESFAYDQRGRVIESSKLVQGMSATTEFSYDDGDHLDTITYPDGEVVRHYYGAVGQMVGIEEDSGASIYVADVDYDVFGRVEKFAHGNGISDMHSFHTGSENFRLAGIHVAGPSTIQLNMQYSYNDLGKIEHIQDLRNSAAPLSNTADFTYDELARLTEAAGTSYGQGYEYDNIGNITQAGSGPLYYDPAKPHQVDLRGMSLQVQHDANGNLTVKQTQDNAIINSYDALNRMIGTSFYSGSNQQTYKYDYTGRRVFRQVNATAPERYFSNLVEFDGTNLTKYYFAGKRLIAARQVYDPTFGTHAPPAAPIRIPPELPFVLGCFALVMLLGFGRRERRLGVALTRSRAVGTALLVLAAAPPIGLFSPSAASADCDPSTNVLHYHLDHLGSAQVITDHEGLIHQQIRYKAYGQIRGRWDANNASMGPSIFGLTREFTGYETDALTGFLYAGARYYDTDLGQFLSQDPARQFASPYAYGPGDPMNGTDPNGTTFGIPELIMVVVLAASLANIAYKAYQAVQAGAPIGSVIAQSIGQAVMMIAAAYVGGVVLGAIPFPAAVALRAASIGYGAYNTVQAAKDGDVSGAVAAGVGTAGQAYGLGSRVHARAQIGKTPYKFESELLNLEQSAGGAPTSTAPAWASDPDVAPELNRAWTESNPFAAEVPHGSPGSLKQEQGGWVRMNRFTGERHVLRVPGGTRDSLSLPKPGWSPLYRTEGWFHTHPNTAAEGYTHVPSPADIRFTTNYAKVPGVIMTHGGTQVIPYP